MTIRKILVLVAVGSLFLGGCAPKQNARGSIRGVGRTSRGDFSQSNSGTMTNGIPTANASSAQNGPYEPTSGKYWGAIVRGNYDQATFQARVSDLLSNISNSNGTPISLGVVSGDPGQSTGIRFWGNIEGLGGVINPNGGNSLQVNPATAHLRIAVYDSLVGTADQSGNLLTEIPIDIASGVPSYSVSGTISGNTATIYFTDDFGTIELSGTFNASTFTGWIYYDNNFYWDTPNKSSALRLGAAGYLGVFSVYTCGFFQCGTI